MHGRTHTAGSHTAPCTYRTNASVWLPADQRQQPCASYRTFLKNHTANVHIKIPNPYIHRTHLVARTSWYVCMLEF